MQAPAHSVLFDLGEASESYNAGDGTGMYADLDFEPMAYNNDFGAQGQGDSSMTGDVNDFYSGSYDNNIPPLVERSWVAAFGTGGFPNEPPLLQGRY